MTVLAPPSQAPDRLPLATRSLRAMLDRGFDGQTLLAMQDMAYRSTAQTLMHRELRASAMSLPEVTHIAEQHVGGPVLPSGELGPRQSAMYIQFRAMSNQLPARQALQDAQAIVFILKFQAAESRHCAATEWLGRTLHDLRRQAASLVRSTPIFAAEITRKADAIVDQHPDPLRLKNAILMAENMVDGEQEAETLLPNPQR